MIMNTIMNTINHQSINPHYHQSPLIQVRRSEMLANHVTAVKEMPLLPVRPADGEEEDRNGEKEEEEEEELKSTSPSLMEETAAGSEDSISDMEEGFKRRP